MFQQWGDWTTCSQSCKDLTSGSQGKQSRSRTCHAAKNGGEKCPHPIREKEKYKEFRSCPDGPICPGIA